MAPRVEITYCTGCNWLLRAGWMAQEILQSFRTQIGSVALMPDDSGGVFRITVDGTLVWDRKRDGGFPDVKTLKTRLRDQIDPEIDLGHLDRLPKNEAPDA
ncbi:MAG: SelT/SelW/SelH family protein [Pseudomonadota bacterium]